MNWEDIFQSIVMEVDGKKMPESIATARQAIQARLTTLSNGDHTERDRLDHALKALAVLETESREWSSR